MKNTVTIESGIRRATAFKEGSGSEAVLLLHGFPDIPTTWRAQVNALAEAGYTTYAPYLPGYEETSQFADQSYFLLDVAEEILAWADALGLERFHLVGHDWGAMISYVTAALAPERLFSLTTLAVPHLKNFIPSTLKAPQQLGNSWYIFFFQMAGLADFALERNHWAIIDKLWQDWSPGWDADYADMERVKEQLGRPGVKNAALSYYRCLVRPLHLRWRETTRYAFAPIKVPTLVMYGDQDGCIAPEVNANCLDRSLFPGGLTVEVVPKAGHFLQQEKPAIVNNHLLNHLRRFSPAGAAQT